MSIRSKVLLQLEKKPRRAKELKQILGNDRKVKHALDTLEQKGKIQKKAGVYYLVKQDTDPALRKGTVVKLGPTFGFVAQQEGQDIFIPGKGLGSALVGDEVLVKLFRRPRVEGSLEGEIIQVTKPRQRFVGTIYRERGRCYFAPDDSPFLLLKVQREDSEGLQTDEKVAVKVVHRGFELAGHRVAVKMRFGNSDKAANCARALAFGAGVVQTFPDEVERQAAQLEPVSPDQYQGRLDLRDLPIFTIDGPYTKDIDDAVMVRRTETGFELGVHIADVSHYVKAGSALDEEAFQRGTSVYYANQVAPMLPRRLSNDLCSLNEKVDRLALSCIMQLDEQGRLVDYRFAKSVIQSRVKGVYGELNTLLEQGEQAPQELHEKYAQVKEQLPWMKELYQHRTRLRRERNGIELESRESKLILDEQERCVQVVCAQRGTSEAMIEEFMLLANQCAASLAKEKGLPFVYRVHEEPEAQRVERLRAVLRVCGLPDHFAGQVPTQRELCDLLEQTKGTQLEPVVHISVLRSMAKACYQPNPRGHFGLALEDYAHFTSPIRRYPDLAIHRVLTDYLAGVSQQELERRYTQFVQQASTQSSAKEISAMQLERRVEDCYKAECMHQHLGEEWPGVISGVAKQGLYVELENTVEGLVHSESLCRSEPVLVEGVRLLDPQTGNQWSLGDKVMVRITRTDVPGGHVDLSLV